MNNLIEQIKINNDKKNNNVHLCGQLTFIKKSDIVDLEIEYGWYCDMCYKYHGNEQPVYKNYIKKYINNK